VHLLAVWLCVIFQAEQAAALRARLEELTTRCRAIQEALPLAKELRVRVLDWMWVFTAHGTW
jgi:hypothetical protein